LTLDYKHCQINSNCEQINVLFLSLDISLYCHQTDKDDQLEITENIPHTIGFSEFSSIEYVIVTIEILDAVYREVFSWNSCLVL